MSETTPTPADGDATIPADEAAWESAEGRREMKAWCVRLDSLSLALYRLLPNGADLSLGRSLMFHGDDEPAVRQAEVDCKVALYDAIRRVANAD